MIHGLDAVRGGFDVDADVVIVGSGAGGAVAALNLARAGMKVALLEAGPQVTPKDMTVEAPTFLSRYYWEGGLRMMLGSGAYPTMSGRVLGGSTVVNSAIMYPIPDWVRDEWRTENGLDFLAGDALDHAYRRAFARVKRQPTSMDVMFGKNLVTRDVLTRAGVPNNPLPRAVDGCKGAGQCLTGCPHGAKQSVDKSHVPDAVAAGAQVYTCAMVDRILFEGGRAVGVTGRVVDPLTHEVLAPFTVRAPRVIASAGALHTPVLLQRSGVSLGGRVGGTLQAHISGLAVGVMPQLVEPWKGATQGWGGFSPHTKGLKFESLWAPTSMIAAEWGGLGPALAHMLPDFRHALMIVLVYRAKVSGGVRARSDGLPDAKLWIPTEDMHTVLREVHRVTRAFLDEGARYVFTGVRGVPDEVRTTAQADALLDRRLRPRHCTMTLNHVFASCPMHVDPAKGVVGTDGRVHGVPGLWIADASIFPSASAVNPQGTVMALADLISRQLGELALDAVD